MFLAIAIIWAVGAFLLLKGWQSLQERNDDPELSLVFEAADPVKICLVLLFWPITLPISILMHYIQ
jgi:hypothetical protein